VDKCENMRMKYLLSIDQGTTSSRAIVFDENQNIISESQKEYELQYPKDGWVEANPDEILGSVKETIKKALESSKVEIAACGITNQRETVVVWDRVSGEAIYPAIIWQDRRTSDLCSELKQKENLESEIREKTGLLLDPYFSATKIKWILDNVENAKKMAENGELCFGTIESFLIWNLTEEKNHKTDATNASRTMLMNLETLEWDDSLLEIFNIPKNILPEICSCDDTFGLINLFDQKFPITGVIGDQQSALFGQNCFEFGEMKSTYGTGCFLMVNTKEKIYKSEARLLSTVGCMLGSTVSYALEGSIFSAGTSIQWLRDEMKFFDDSSESEDLIDDEFDSRGVNFIPAFTGLGAPHWNSEIRGSIHGIQRDSSKVDLITAVFKAICFQTLEIVEALEHDGVSVSALKVDGGMVKNKKFLQLLSNTLSTNIKKPDQIESTAVGAFKIALLGSGIKDIDEIQKIGSYDEVKSQQSLKLNDDYQIWKEYLAKNL
jgi:glycerol kinase